MLSFLRNFLSSWVALFIFAMILLGVVVTGVGTGTGGLGNLAGGSGGLARIGRESIGASDAQRSVQQQFNAAREQQPGLDIAAFIKSGGVDQVIDQMINSRTFSAFGGQQGMAASQRLVDAELLNIPAFRGPTGRFDRNIFLGVLNQRGITENDLRNDIGRSKLASMLIVPAGGAARVPAGLVSPYAALLLEARTGQIATVPTAALNNGPAPTDTELQNFYNQRVASYTAPETRIFRYALFDKKRFEASAKPSEQEIADAYRAKAETFAAKETRVLTQAILPSEAAATGVAAKVREGASIADAAKAAGSEATTLAALDKAGFSALTSKAVADAAFSAAQGAISAPVKSALGWHVVRVDKLTRIGGKSVAEARSELLPGLVKAKAETAFADFVTKLDDAAGDGVTFDEIVKANGLSSITTPALTAGGVAPADRSFKGTPELGVVLKDAFQADVGDEPAVISVAPGQVDAIYKLDKIIPAAPRPLAAIRDQVATDFKLDRANRAAKKLADSIAAHVKAGTPFAQAVSGSGTALPATRPMRARRLDLVQAQGRVPPPLALLFSMARKTAKVLEAPDKQGWYVVWLDTIEPGDTTAQPQLLAVTQQQMTQVVGDEYVGQFLAAMKADLKVSKNAEAVAALKKSLSGSAGGQ